MGDQELGMATGCNGRFAEKTAKHSRGGSFPWRDEEMRQLFTDTAMEVARYEIIQDDNSYWGVTLNNENDS